MKANVVDYLQHGSYSQDVVYRSDSYLQDKLIHKWGTDLTKDQEARYTYDTLGRRSYEKTSGVVVEDLRPTKDRWGALTSYNDRNELTGYRLYEMTASWSVSSTTAIAGTRQSYTLDHMGNRTGGHQNDVSGTYTSSNPHDGLNQYSTARNLTVDYDNAGNMTDYGTKDYAYDAEDRLVKVTVGTTHYKYKYDYLGRRIGKYTGSTLNKKFVYQGWNLIAELSSTGSVQRTFTWGLDVSTTLHGAGGVGGLLMIDDESTSKRYYPIYDGSRNIVGLYDQAGALVASYEYDAFGRIILQSSGDYSDDNPFRFSTKYTDDETGLIYYGHRFYEPELGRFINRDPIEEDGGLNLYGFVGNDPVNFYDYLGMVLSPPLRADDFNYSDEHKNEEADPDILDDELRDEAEGRARAIAMERAGGLLSWIVQGAPVTYLDRLEGLYEATLDRVEGELDRYYDEIGESRSGGISSSIEVAQARTSNVTLPSINSDAGVLARVLIAESLNPGYQDRYNEAETLKAMRMMRAVYENRLKNNPGQFGARGASTLTDVITAPGQTHGFTLDSDRNLVISFDVQNRIDVIVGFANTGVPGAYARMVQNAIDVGTGVISSLDPFAGTTSINGITVTGGLYGFRTAGASDPGGRFVSIPSSMGGVVGGQQFYTLEP